MSHFERFYPAKSPRFLHSLRAQVARPSPIGPERIPDRRARQIRWLARIWTTAMVALFWVLLLSVGAPFLEDAGTWQAPVQTSLLLVVTAGMVLAWRWEIAGATVMLVSAAGLGILATLSFDPAVAFLPFAAFLAPSVLYWIVWQRTQPAYAIVILGLFLSLVLFGGAYGAERVYDHYYGPSHPVSTTIQPPADAVDWAWAGGTTARSTIVKARILSGVERVRLAVSERPSLAQPRFVDPAGSLEGEVMTFEVSGLEPETQYYYAVEADGEIDDNRRGVVRTFPEGATSFTFAFGSCACTGSNGMVYDRIRESDPLFFLIGGDLFYGDIGANNSEVFEAYYQAVLSSPAQATLYRSTSIAYVWDDHDFGPDDSDRTSPSREAALQVYDEYVPHYELRSRKSGPIYQAFTAGRARFILTDLRSARDPASTPDGPEKSMMGAEQKAWFKEQLLEAKDKYPIIVWVSSVPWIDEPIEGADHWAGYATERREISDFIAQNDISGLLMLAGDAHMLAIDDGTNSDYSESGDAGFPVFHAGALDRFGSDKGGPYSEGAISGGGHFGLVKVEDGGGDRVSVELSGRDWTGAEIIGYRYTVEVDSD